jgi:phage terminase large subunit-like protein
VGETNNGGDMVEAVIRAVDPTVNYKGVNASRGKRIRAEPIAAFYKRRMIEHVRRFTELETQSCGFSQNSNVSPDRMDANVWGFTELMLTSISLDGPFMVNV